MPRLEHSFPFRARDGILYKGKRSFGPVGWVMAVSLCLTNHEPEGYAVFPERELSPSAPGFSHVRLLFYLLPKPQADCAACETVSSAWTSLINPWVRNASTTCATAETYWPWFFHAPPE